MSKAHPRSSDDYQSYKQEIKRSKEAKREFLTQAKEIYYNLFNDERFADRSKIN